MTSKPILLISTLFFALLITGCSGFKGDTGQQMHFQTINVQNITSISVHDPKGKSPSNTDGVELVRLQDKESIENVFGSLKSLKNNWVADLVGVPVGRYQVVFWQDSERLASISFGQSFFVGQGCGYFFANSVGMEEIAQFQTAVGIDEALSFEW